MTNQSDVNFNYTQSEFVVNHQDVFKGLWLAGICVSILGFLTQNMFFILIPKCRKFDEKVLTQLSFSRILNTVCEFYILNCLPNNSVVKDVIYVTYFHTDFVLVCWMFIFTKNLYDKIVVVFPIRRCKLVLISALIWILTLPLGLTATFTIKTNTDHFQMYYNIYAHVKFFIVVINALIFYQIFHVAFRRGVADARNTKDYVKTAIVAFILVCIMSLQVFATDLLSFYYGSNLLVTFCFCVINSYQVVAITLIFILLAKSTIRESVLRTMSIRLNEIVS